MRAFFGILVTAFSSMAWDGPWAADAGVDDGAAPSGRFEFGSYGRAGIGSDLQGQLGRSSNIVSHGPRLIEDSYAELELRREDVFGEVASRIVATLAFFPPFFHFSGNAAQHIALRNLYAEATIDSNFSAWVGSRMYRGDDIYLLNFWPLDDLNTIGGGLGWRPISSVKIQAHVGMQRLDSSGQYQVVPNVNPLGYGSILVARLNRPRIIESLKAQYEQSDAAAGYRFSLYGEAHQLSSGVERNETTGDERALPSDTGFMVGGQATGWKSSGRFVHLWVRHATGIAVYDELGFPSSFANDLTTQGAHATRIAFAGGWDGAKLGVTLGSYLDWVRAAGIATVTSHKYDEGAIAARLQWYVIRYFGVAVEANVQRRVYALVDSDSGRLRSGTVGQFAVMPYFSPLGHGLFARPQLRLIYALSLRDRGAQSFSGSDDVFSSRSVDHFIGLNVEWWFNAVTYPAR